MAAFYGVSHSGSESGDSGPMFGGDIRQIVSYLEGLEGSLRRGKAFGDFRPELRAWLLEAGAEAGNRFANPPPNWSVSKESVKRRLVRNNAPYPPGTDVWKPTPAAQAYAGRYPNRIAPTGFRGLRGAASNVSDKNKMGGTSLVKVAWLSAQFGVNSAEDGIPYAKSVQAKTGFMDLSHQTKSYLSELVRQGLEERMKGKYDYTGRSGPGRRLVDE